MGMLVCKFCGTNYPEEAGKCPLCNATNAPTIADEFDFLDEDFEATSRVVSDTIVMDDLAAGVNSALNAQKRETHLIEEPVEPIPAPQAETTPPRRQRELKEPVEPEETEEPEDEKESSMDKSNTILIVLIVLLSLSLIAVGVFAALAFDLIPMGKAPEDESLSGEQADQPEDPEPEPVEIACTGVKLNLTEVTLQEAGATQQLKVTVTPEDSTDQVRWISAAPQIATVADGLVTAVSEGSVNILVTCGDFAASCMVTVDFTPEEEEPKEEEPTDEPTEDPETPEQPQEPEEEEEDAEPMSLSHSDISLFYPGEMARLWVENSGEKKVTWSADKPDLIKVDDDGLITAIASGKYMVYAEVDGQRFECIVRCNLGTPEGELITVHLNQSDISLFTKGETFKLSVKYDDENDEPENPKYTWTSSDTKVVTVDEKGVVTCIGKGTAYVSVEVNGVTLKCIFRCNVTA